jgi:chromosome segregation ATPase
MAALSIEDTPAPKLVPDARTPAEYSRLEQLLAERARELQQHRLEVARLKALLRDATADFERALSVPPEPPVSSGELARQRDAAVLRALEAEAARAEAVYRLDEAMGYMAEASPGRPLEEECARLGDTVRRLEGELAASRSECQEAREAREQTARELATALERAQGVERQLATDGREQLKAQSLAEALEETRSVLGEFARAVERVALGGVRRESSLGAKAQPADE